MQKVDKLFVALKAFIVHEGRVLLLQESTEYVDGANAGRWDVVGGRVQPGEYWQDALQREIKEETGLTVQTHRPFAIGEWRPQVRGEQWQVIATFVKCAAPSDMVVLSEDHAAYQWIDPQNYQTVPNYASFIPEAFKEFLRLAE